MYILQELPTLQTICSLDLNIICFPHTSLGGGGGGKSSTAGIEPCTMRSEMFIFVMLNHRIGAYKCIFVSFSRTECKTEKLE